MEETQRPDRRTVVDRADAAADAAAKLPPKALSDPAAALAAPPGAASGSDAASSASAASPQETLLVWPPPDEELEGWEVVALAGPASLRSGASEPAGGAERRPEIERTRPGLDAGELRPGETAAARLRRLVAATTPAAPTDDELFGDGETPSAIAPVAPAGQSTDVVRASDAVTPAPVASRGFPLWVVPLAFLMGAGLGFAAGAWGRPAVASSRPTASLTVETTSPGAGVTIDGVRRGETPLKVELLPGDRRVVVEGAGGTREAVVPLTAGTDVTRHFDLGAPASASLAPATATGSLEIQTRPPGARVVIAGQARGTTPLTVTGLAPGTHEVTLITSERTVTQQVQVQAGRPSMLVVPMSGGAVAESGWIAVRSSLPLRILERGRVVGTTESDRIMLPAGRHDLEFVNERLEVRVPQSVTVPGGREVAFDVVLPNGQISLNAQPWAEVYVGGSRLGETPLGNVSLPVGDHDIVFRHPQLGERRQTVTVRAATPARVSVSFSP